MRVAFITETPMNGKYTKNFNNIRTEIAWQIALDADHFNFSNFNSVKGYDVVFVIFPKFDVNLNSLGIELAYLNNLNIRKSFLKLPIIQTLKEKNTLVCNIQEGPSWFFNDYKIEEQFNFYNSISECDIIFAHNEADLCFYRGMFPQTKISYIPSLMIINEATCPWKTSPEEKAIIGGNFCRWHGGFQSYIVASDFNVPIYAPSSHCKQKGEEKVPNLTHLPWVEWSEWMKTLSTFKYAVNLMPTLAAGTFSMNCLSGDTDIVTIDGIKNIKDVRIGDYVISKNMTSGDSEWKIVTNLIKSPKQTTYHIKGRSIDFITTGNHNLIIKKRNGRRKNNIGYKNEFHFESVSDIYKQVSQPKARRKLPEFSVIKNHIIRNKKYPYLNINGASLLGWFISEGNTRDWNVYPNDHRIDIAQRKLVNQKNYREICDLLHNMGYKYNPYPDRISFVDKSLKKYLINNVGMLCHNKRIPPECFSWMDEMRMALWMSMMKGGGDTTYTTTSPQLQKDFAVLSMTLGFGVTLSKPIIQKSNKHHTRYKVYIRKTKGCLLYAKNISKDIDQETYCIEVKDNHNFVAGRNGKFQFIGNCAYFGIPCIGNNLFTTQTSLFPELSVAIDDIYSARTLALRLKNDFEFYKSNGARAKTLLIESYHYDVNKWISYIKEQLSNKK